MVSDTIELDFNHFRSQFIFYLFYLSVSGSNLKVNYNPYLIDIVLFSDVDSLKHKATVKDGVLSITLMKKEPMIWNQLELELDKEAFKQTKAEALKTHYQLEEQLATQQKDRKVEEERHAVRQQMALDSAERERMETLQAEEKAAAEKDVYETLARLQQGDSKKPESIRGALASSNVGDNKTKKHVSFTSNQDVAATTSPVSSKPKENNGATFDKTIFEVDDIGESSEPYDEGIDDDDKQAQAHSNGDSLEEPQLIMEEEEEVRYIPPPRQIFQSSEENKEVLNSKVTINFTPRLFPTPMRESKAAEEEDWIAKNRRHLKNHGVLGKSLKKGKHPTPSL